MHGLYEPEEEEEEPGVQECPRCKELNEPKAVFCQRCGFGLDPDRAVSFDEQMDSDAKQSYAQTDPDDTETQDKLRQLDNLLEDPEIKQALLKRVGDE